jgi:hypothetical protein
VYSVFYAVAKKTSFMYINGRRKYQIIKGGHDKNSSTSLKMATESAIGYNFVG